MKKSNSYLLLRKKFRVVLAALFAMLLVPAFAFADVEGGTGTRSAGDKSSAVDPNTTQEWSVEDDTADLGRIWTDKTVFNEDAVLSYSTGGTATVEKGESDFLTVLSAISSASNTLTTTTKPLDIVLVLDVSGSMADDFGTYQAVYTLNTRQSYYIQLDSDYQRVHYDSRRESWGYETGDWFFSQWHSFSPKTSAEDSDPSHVQFYSRANVSKLDALKTAANSFIDSIEAENAKVTDETKKHKVSIVKFAGKYSDRVGNETYYDEWGYQSNFSQIVKNLTLCEGDEKNDLTSSVNALKAVGATSADYGMQHANSALATKDARAGAKKVVVFFTDGEPNRERGFDPNVANATVSAALTLKNNETDIYTIGVMQGANPSDYNDKINQYMHAVSSNFPQATTYTNRGTQIENPHFYLAATDPDGLKKVFDDIASTISQGSGYPTETTEGDDEQNSGYITFKDQLGGYMKVDGFNTILFGNKLFKNPTKTTSENVDTYTFEGSVDTPLYSQGSLGNIVITVTRATDAQTGDVVEVKIPAALIPVCYFDINNTTGDMSVSKTDPIRVCYTSSIKEGVIEKLANPDEALAKYMADHFDKASGDIEFFANKWNGDENLGDVTATFNPAKGNTYYYFAQDTPIYTNEECTTPAQELTAGTAYYYKHAFCALEDGKKADKERVVTFEAKDSLSEIIAKDKDGNSYFKQGASRDAYISELYSSKEKNVTKTANDVLNPTWEESSVAAAATIVSYLGNNGKLMVKNPSELNYSAVGDVEITKVLQGHNMAEKQFKFEVTVSDEASQEKLGFTSGTLDSPAAEDGKTATIKTILKSLRGGEDLIFTCDDIDKRYEFKVTEKIEEKENPGYTYDKREWTVRIDIGIKDAKVKATTTVSSNAGDPPTTWAYIAGEQATSIAHVDFKNSYDAKGSVEVDATKELMGRPLTEEEFEFALHYEDDTEVLKEATNDAQGEISFGELKYDVKFLNDLVGKEKAASEVGDDGNKTWTIKYLATESTDELPGGVSATKSTIPFTVTVVDQGDGTLKATAQADEDDDFVFKNTYSTGEPVSMELSGKKILEAEQGFVLGDITDKFTFTITSDDAKAPMPKDAQGKPITQATNDKNGKVDFGTITFSLEDLNNALTNEEAQTDGVEQGQVRTHTFTYSITEEGSVPGVTNDPETSKKVQFKLTDDGQGHFKVEKIPSEDVAFKFTNTYSVTPQSSSITDQLSVKKVLEGRDLIEGEFSFNLIEDDEVVATGTNAGDGTVTFDSIAYTEPGEHTYVMMEEKAGTTEAGITYSLDTYTIVTEVVDKGDGTLGVTHSFKDPDVLDATFTNTYEVDPVTVQLSAGKELAGAELSDKQFTFILNDYNGEEFAKAQNNAAGQIVFPAIEFGEPGTYTFTMTEFNDAQAGITYDENARTIKVNVTDDLQGHLKAEVIYDGQATAPVFKNTFTPGSVKPTTKTGDSLGVLIGLLVAIVVIAGVGVGIAYKNSRTRQGLSRRRH